MIKIKCRNCGKEFSIYKYRLNMSKDICCSRKCGAELTTRRNGGTPINVDKIKNSNNFYYLMGLISTDGYIHVGLPKIKHNRKKLSIKRYIRISLARKDKDILYKIKDVIGGNVKDYPNRKTGLNSIGCTVWETSQNDFIDHILKTTNIQYNNKTFNLNVTEWFNGLSPIQKLYYIRGVFDGDGGITIHKNKTLNSIGWNTSIITASLDFINMLINYFKSCNIYTRYKEINKKYHYCYWTKKQFSVEMLDHIYGNISNDDLYINRKYEKYKIIKDNYVKT